MLKISAVFLEVLSLSFWVEGNHTSNLKNRSLAICWDGVTSEVRDVKSFLIDSAVIMLVYSMLVIQDADNRSQLLIILITFQFLQIVEINSALISIGRRSCEQ